LEDSRRLKENVLVGFAVPRVVPWAGALHAFGVKELDA
jgi:hypothetical protein